VPFVGHNRAGGERQPERSHVEHGEMIKTHQTGLRVKATPLPGGSLKKWTIDYSVKVALVIRFFVRNH
jgi:hypothetical protein